jgi:alkylation response protein AidB-like acyl-CoA dehydrogenase
MSAIPDIPSDLQPLLEKLSARATELDRTGNWPADDLADLAAAGAMRWAIDRQFGGIGLAPLELHLHYEAISSASLSTALVLTQRDSAALLVQNSPDWAPRHEFLAALCGNEFFTTIGIAQLTTSRQGGKPALSARRREDGWRIDGVIPWSTGPAFARCVIAGAACEDGRQILFSLPMDRTGVTIEPPMKLVALSSSWTTSVQCRDVHVSDAELMRGPAAKVVGGPSKGLPLSQSFLALGLCRAAIDAIGRHKSPRGQSTHDVFAEQFQDIRRRVIEACQPSNEPSAPIIAALRGQCHDLAVRVTHAAVALYKGSALLLDNPIQRFARESMFLLVWSCPDPVVDCTVAELAGE